MPANYRQILSVDQAVGISRQAAKIAMDRIAAEMKPRMERLCPVKTGALKASIKLRTVAGGSEPRIEVSTLHYGEYQDVNPGYTPFVTPVLEQKQWVAKFGQYVRAAVAQVARARSLPASFSKSLKQLKRFNVTKAG